MEQREYLYPGLLALASVMILFAATALFAEKVGQVMFVLTLQVVVQVVLGVVGCFIAAALLGISFGPISSAIVKLTATVLVPIAVMVMIPIEFVGWFIALICYWVLLAWLFSLEGRELVITVITLFVVRFIGWLILLPVIASL